MPNKSFVHLHCHADASMLDGLALVAQLVPAAERLGMPAIALTDHGSMAATYDLYKVAKNSNVKPIFGIEAYLAPQVPRTHKTAVRWNNGGEDDVSGAGAYTHMTLLAETDEGLRNLFIMSSESYLSGIYRKPRMDLELLQTYGKGIIATTGCPSGEIQTLLRIGDYEKAKASAAQFAEIFGKESFFVELMDHGLDIEKRVIRDLLKLSKELGLRTVATNDLHYINKADAKTHEALLCISSGSRLSDPNRFKFDANDFYLKTAEEMRAIWDTEAPDACDNTLLIAERCNAHFEEGNSYMPKFPIPEGHTEETWFAHEVREGLKKRFPEGIPDEHKTQAEYEIDIITQMGFPGYFLIVADFINWAKNNGIWVGPGRGCLSGESNILTPTGFKKIKDIHVGDIVFDDKGNQVVVPQVFKYECDEPLVEVKAHYGGQGIKMTADHKVLVSKAKRVTNKSKIAQGIQYERGITPPMWIRADEIEKGDLVVMPKLSFPLLTTGFNVEQHAETLTNLEYEHSVRKIAERTGAARSTVMDFFRSGGEVKGPITLKVKEYFDENLLTVEGEKERRFIKSDLKADWIPADYDAGLLFGIFISDGCIRKDERATVCFAQRKSEDEGMIPQVIDRVFGISPTINDSKERDLRQYSVNHKGVHKLFQRLFPDYDFSSQTKYIPDEFFTTSEEFRRGLLEGLWYGDGSHSSSKSKYGTVSPRLAENVFTLLSSLGLPAGIKSYQRKESRPEYNKTGREFWTEYSVTTAHNFDTDALIMGFGYDGDYTYYRVREINEVPAEEFVYDFTVPTTNSYVTDSYVVHNSAAGSSVAYAMGITELDPIKNGLIFERFLNPERVSPPDIDIDFDDQRRGEVIEYVKQKYGEDKVANIGTFMKIKAKAAIKDAARVLDMPYALGDQLTKVYPPPIVGRDLSLHDAYDPSNERYKEAEEFRNKVASSPEAMQVIELAKGLEGVKRGHGMHAAGVIMSSEPIMLHVPLMKRDNDAPIMTQFEYPTCENMGLIKMDFLGLSNLTTIGEALRLIEQNRGVDVKLREIWKDMNDPATYKLLAQGDTIGVFQLDSAPIRSLLRLMVPDRFDDISAVLALYRPGPMGVNAHIDYADRKNGRKPIVPIHPELEEPLKDILGDTWGLCLTGETLIWDATQNKEVRIDSIEHQVKTTFFYTLGVDQDGTVGVHRVAHWQNHGIQNTFTITTENGSSITATAEHRMLTPSGWKEVKDLIPGVDHFAIPTESSNSRDSSLHSNNGYNYFNSKMKWVLVSSIEPAGKQEVFDIEVEDVHNFLANGLVSKNCIYQEQVMSIAQKVGGYSLGQADLLRRAMGKKKKEILDKEYAPFEKAALERGYSKEAVNTLWEVLVPFSDYAFNRAHSAAYGYISYATAWLKANYPVEYMAALLSTNANDKDKTALYLNECRQMGIPVLPPDVNSSVEKYNAVGDSIRVGLIAVKNVGHNLIQAILDAREGHGPFMSFGDFLNAAPVEVLKKRAIESLIKAGAFDEFGYTRNGLTLVHAEIIDMVLKVRKTQLVGQDSLFADSGEDPGVDIIIPDVKEWDRKKKLAFEREMLGLYVSDHPLNGYEHVLKSLSEMSIADAKETTMASGSNVRLAGLITSVDRKKTKKGDSWAILTVEDLGGSIQIYCFPKSYEKAYEAIQTDNVVQIDGRVEHRDDGTINITGNEIKLVDLVALSDPDSIPFVLNVEETQITPSVIAELKELFREFSGPSPVHLKITKADGSVVVLSVGSEYKVKKSASLISGAKSILGFGAV